MTHPIHDMKQDNNKEIFPVVDEQGNTIGSATRGECHNGSKLLHPVVCSTRTGAYTCSNALYGRISSPANGTLPWADT